jgi:hypothetical protein
MPSLPTASDTDVPRVRLVPKKSKLGLLGGAKEKVKQQQHSKTGSSGRGGFDIYVDPTYDPDIGEIVMVKKKKSRAALDGMQWGPLGEVTNVAPVPPPKQSFLRPKSEEKEKWWTIGRGRKDSKEKSKEAERQKDIARSKCKSLPMYAASYFYLSHSPQLLPHRVGDSIHWTPSLSSRQLSVASKMSHHPSPTLDQELRQSAVFLLLREVLQLPVSLVELPTLLQFELSVPFDRSLA